MEKANHLVDTIRRIGYPKANCLDPHALEWAYELEATLPFLEWFSSSINEDNTVSVADIQEYKHIQDDGTALSGVRLEEALKAFNKNITALGDSENFKSDINQLRESLARKKAQKKTLMARWNKLSLHHMVLSSQMVKMEEVEQAEVRDYKAAVESCRADNEKLSEVLHGLSESVQSLIKLYNLPTPEQNVKILESPFISQQDLSSYQEAEEKFSHCLTSFTKKQFFKGVATLTGDQTVDKLDLADVDSLGSISLTADASLLDDCREFFRLQKIFPGSECNRINALVAANKALSAVNEAKSILHLLKTNQFPTSSTELSRLHLITEQNLEAIRREATELTSSLPDLIRELGGLQGTEVLTGDYNLKLQRQDYFSQKQDKVIQQLVVQRARAELLVMLLELESKWHRETHHLLSAARQLLQENLAAWQQRMKELEDPDLDVSRLDRNVVDLRDESSVRLYHLLGRSPEDESMMYLAKQKVVEQAQKCDSQYKEALVSNRTLDETFLGKVNQLEDCLKNCMAVLYGGSTSLSGQPTLSPPQLQSAITELTSKMVQLQTDLTTVVSDVESKKMALKKNVLLVKERELFILFHTDPSRLLYVVNGLADRLKAIEIK